MNSFITTKRKGFTLIEVLVSVSIFAIVMLISTGAVFSIVGANNKTHTLKSVMTNLNFALESMARDIRVGFKYTCNDIGDCPTGGTVFRYKANRDVNNDGVYNASDANDQIEYSRSSNGRIMKRVYGSSQYYAITATEMNITSMTFYVIGTGASDGKQPKVVITITGYAGTGANKSNFNIETTISQRSIDS